MKMEITDEASSEIQKMRFHVNRIAAMFGEDSPETLKASISLNEVLAAMLNLGGKISRDGELSLFGSNDYISYGVVWFPNRNLDEETLKFCEKHNAIPGEWSVHS